MFKDKTGLKNVLDSRTGKKINPCNKPNATIPNTILKNILKISLDANAVAITPTKVLVPLNESKENKIKIKRKKKNIRK